jgi:hypothetical protein
MVHFGLLPMQLPVQPSQLLHQQLHDLFLKDVPRYLQLNALVLVLGVLMCYQMVLLLQLPIYLTLLLY